jgi:hypothetical protein
MQAFNKKKKINSSHLRNVRNKFYLPKKHNVTKSKKNHLKLHKIKENGQD